MFNDLKESTVASIERAIVECQQHEWRTVAAQWGTTSERMAAELIFQMVFEKPTSTPCKPPTR